MSVMSAARDDPEDEPACLALETLCRTYWYPLYIYVRRRGHGPHESEDLIQEFFARLLEKRFLSQVDPAKGRFRSFLMAAITHFLANERDRLRAAKRGGQVRFLSLDDSTAESRYVLESAPSNDTPQTLYERGWAIALIQEVLARLRSEFSESGKAGLFDELKTTLVNGRGAESYTAQAARLNMTEAALKMAVHRLRQRYAQILRQEVARTVNDPAEIEDE